MNILMEEVAQFKEAHGHKLPDKLHTPDEKRLDLLTDLIIEECTEVMDAIYDDDGNLKINHVELAKELADLVYVTVGLAVECGIPLDKVWDEVHASNMAKIGPDGKFVVREDGKILKPEGWQKPDIEGCLK